MKKETTETTTAVAQTVFKKAKPALTAKQQLQAIAIAMHQKATAEVAEYNKKVNEQNKLVLDIVNEQYQENATSLKVEDYNDYGSQGYKIYFLLPWTDKLKTQTAVLNHLKNNRPRVYSVPEYVSQLRQAQVNKSEDMTVLKLLESPEIVNKLAAFGKDLIEGVKNKQAITL